MSIVILEGIGRQLAPDLNLFHVAAPTLAKCDANFRRAAMDVAVDIADQVWKGSC